jgi:2-C-methyl-D-erythritol 4-phosphate cytidylyltransferase
MKRYAIIVAGGSGSRMKSEVPKQFLILKDKPILLHTIEKFTSLGEIKIIVVLPKNQISYWVNLCSKFTVPEHEIVAGGETRFHSSQNGINALNEYEEGIVAIHDGVRPLVTKDVLEKAYNLAEEKGTAVVAVDSKDSIRIWNPNSDEYESVDRNSIRLIQTPQVFKKSILESAFELHYKSKFTDDASVVEEFGSPIFLSEGNYQNIKITTPEDLQLAEIILKEN